MSSELDARIALVRGWTDLRRNIFWSDQHDFTGIPPSELRTYVPRWSSSLDLMWGLEEQLAEKAYIDYCVELMIVFQKQLKTVSSLELVVHATAEQKARAYLAIVEAGQ